jgi:hypothetical protein
MDKTKEKKMAYYKVTMRQTWEWEVLMHADNPEQAQEITEIIDWGEPLRDETETVSIVELEEKKDE